MKKRLMSKLLMGALVVLTMGVFSSCKDYDDDINATNTRIDKVVDDLKAQVKALEDAQATCQRNYQAALQAAQAAQASADQALSNLEQAKTDLNAAIAAGDKAAIDEAQKRIDQALADAKEYADKVAEDKATAAAEAAKTVMLNQLTEKVVELNTAIAGKADLADFNQLVSRLGTDEETFNKAIKDILAEIAALKDANTAQDNVTKAISDKLDEIYARALKDGEIDQAIALLTSQIAAIDPKLVALSTELKEYCDKATKALDEKFADYVTLTALNQTVNQWYYNKEEIDNLMKGVKDDLAACVAKFGRWQDLSSLYNELLKAIEDGDSELQKAINRIDEVLATLATTEYVDGKVEVIKGELATLKTDLEALIATKASQADFDTFKSKTEGDIRDLQGQIANMMTKEEISAAINEAINTTVAAMIAQATSDLEILIGAKADAQRVADLEEKVGQNYTTLFDLIQGLTTSKADAQTVNTLQSTLNTLAQTTVPGINTRLTNLETQLTNMTTELNNLYNELVNLDFDEQEASAGRLLAQSTDNTGLTALVKLLKQMKNNIDELYGVVETRLTNVQDKLVALTLFLDRNLSSIVTKPSKWIYGLPQIDATVIAAQPYYTFAKVGNAAVGTATYREKANASTDTKGYSFDLHAYYWMNPRTYNPEQYDYAFEELPTIATVTKTRGNEDTNTFGEPVITDTKYDLLEGEEAKGKVLDVTFRFANGENVNNALTQNTNNGMFAYVTTLALTATRKADANTQNDVELDANRKITSDYCVVVPNYLNGLALANNWYVPADCDKVQGNNNAHLNIDDARMSGFDKTVNDDNDGKYSFTLQRDKKFADGEKTKTNNEGGYINLDNAIDVHYFNAAGDEQIFTNKQARDAGFDFKYTILTDKDYFVMADKDGNAVTDPAKVQNVYVNPDKGKNAEAAGHVAIIRVELVAVDENENSYTYAYGYVSVLITNTTVRGEVEMPELVLNCDPASTGANGFSVKKSWENDFIAAIKTALGDDFEASYYQFVASEDNMTLWANEDCTEASTLQGKLGKNGTDFIFSFTKDQATANFYTNGAPNTTPQGGYVVYVKIDTTQDGVNQGKMPIIIKVTIPSVTYPSGTFADDYSDRIRSLWFTKFSGNIAPSADDRYETHANVEVMGQTDANNEFIYDISSAFVGNVFNFTPDTGFDINKKAKVFFNASRYFIYTGANGDAWDKTKDADGNYTADYILKGSHGNDYLLYLTSADDLTLKAAKITNGTAAYVAATDPVVVLSGTYNETATFQTNENAKDLLNHARHDQLGEDQTFTTHMILHATDYCLDVAERGNNTFDIRYLRPISANLSGVKTVYDARNDGNTIYVADLVDFVDWRNHAFTATNAIVSSTYGSDKTRTGFDYMKYYGVTTIRANFAAARTNYHNGELTDILVDGKVDAAKVTAWPLITEITDKLLFDPDDNAKAINAGGTAKDNAAWTDDYSGFRVANGFYTYQNNSGGTGDFYITLPVSVVYTWGETEAEWILIHVVKTEGQHNESRLN